MTSRTLDEPGWFAAVMGTGALAAVAAMNNGDPPALLPFSQAVAVVLFTVTSAAFLFLAGRALVVALFRQGLLERITSPASGPHYAAIPGAINVLAVAWLRIQPGAAAGATWTRWIVLALAVAGTFLGLWLTVVFFVSAFEREDLDAEDISGTWFIPETVILLGALLFGQLAGPAPDAAQRSLAVVALALLGVGTLLFGLTAVLFVNRLVLHRQVMRTGAPAMWIMLSPLSVASLAMLSVALDTRYLGDSWGPAAVQTANFAAALFWGFSLWWVAVAAVLTAHTGRAALTSSPADWAFVFPAAALALSTMTLADFWDSGLMQVLGVAFSILLVAIWGTVVAASVTGMRRERRRRTLVA